MTDVLLITANVGSLFENLGDLKKGWLCEFYKLVHKLKPQFIALHCQEIGGKDYELNMSQVETFFRLFLTSVEMKAYDRVQGYLDTDFTSVNTFTALGSMYFVHESLTDIQQYNFQVKQFFQLSEKELHLGNLERHPFLEKEKFSPKFWPEFKWTRKGYTRTRWLIGNRNFNLVNVHLFHDASNLVAYDSSPSFYCGNRAEALRYVINRVKDNNHLSLPFFLFGDFNVRLDTRSLIQNLCSTGEIQLVKNVSSNEVEKIICEENDGNKQVLLHIETKLFEYLYTEIFRADNGQALHQYDQELSAFSDDLVEEDIHFPPSYPYSEDCTQPTQYMNTRCPAWCDRILMSYAASNMVHEVDERKPTHMIYDNIGPNVCMGDHKPIFLFFRLQT
ncbi:inositol polyphosphate-5-phosphatase A-like isoform X2 [Protopterus annectens]|uniref:inositol polyphosphate-5-phosphatase A-like isoform X2 n=1 Tax=Protopterus annectens TaxID=7888 RepID=UPI001CFBF8B9|nr:inositol polyphosphate-5-phosphatase A-like isoform X2 [Protopterus annectens]